MRSITGESWKALRDGRVRADGVAGLRRLNSDLDALLGG